MQLIQIPVEYNSEFMLDILEVFSINFDLNILTEEQQINIWNTLFFFGGNRKLDGVAKGWLKFHTTEQ